MKLGLKKGISRRFGCTGIGMQSLGGAMLVGLTTGAVEPIDLTSIADDPGTGTSNWSSRCRYP
jgi:hypothetical protein